jgi:hypothetical protein
LASVFVADAKVVVDVSFGPDPNLQNWRNPMKDEIAQSKEIKGKILSRIQQQLNKEPGEEGMVYVKANEHHKGGTYCKGGPCPVQPEEE